MGNNEVADSGGMGAPAEVAVENDGLQDTPSTKTTTPEERVFMRSVYKSNVISEALKNGSLSCLPGADGYADTTPAVNIANGTKYHGENMLYLKALQKQHGYPTAEYVTEAAVKDSGIPLMPGAKGVILDARNKNENTGEWENKEIKLYNAAETKNPQKLREWAGEKLGARIQEQQDYMKAQHGDSYKPYTNNKNAPEIKCSSTNPEAYLSQYFAAVSMGGKFKVEHGQAKEFANNLQGEMSAKMKSGYANPYNITKICNAASAQCKDVMRNVGQEMRKEQQQQIGNKGRSM